MKKAKKKRKTASSGFRGKSPLAMVLYGPSGVGKTSFAAHFPAPAFVYDRQEEGIKDLVEFGQCPSPVEAIRVDDFDQILDVCNEIAGNQSVQTAVFDSLTGIEKLIFQYHCRKYYDNDWSSKGFYSFMQGPKNAAKTDVPRFLDALESIRDAGKNVILIAHSEVKTYTNPEGPDYDRYIPVCDKATWQQVHRWAKAVIFYNYFVEIDTRKGIRAKARAGTDARYLYTEWSAAYDAKNRYGLEPIIDAGDSPREAYEAFCKAFDKAANRSPK